MTGPDLIDKLLPAALTWATAVFLVHELFSLDVCWHLAIGKDILQSFSAPAVNFYSAANQGQPYMTLSNCMF